MGNEVERRQEDSQKAAKRNDNSSRLWSFRRGPFFLNLLALLLGSTWNPKAGKTMVQMPEMGKKQATILRILKLYVEFIGFSKRPR